MKNGTFSFYGYSYRELPKEVRGFSDERVSVFFKRKGQKNNLALDKSSDYYSGYQDTPWDSKDIVFFDQDSTKSLCIGFPTKSKYVVVSLKYPRYYLFIIIGILRRLKLRSISIKGLIWLDNGALASPWLVIKCKDMPTNSLTISSEIGISGFLDFLRTNKIRYVVPRFYENLPTLLTPDADLDIIVDSKQGDYVKNFLISNPGNIPIDVYTDFGTDYHGMSYVPPKKAKDVLDSAIEGPGGSLIPCKQDALDLIIYHALYHKGYVSRIPSIKGVPKQQTIKNKYLQVIDSLKNDLDTEVGGTLEEMDRYMDEVGWRPAIDTLAKIAQWNEWVRDFHMSKNVAFVPLYALILKEGLNRTELEDQLKEMCTKEGLEILDEREIVGHIKEKAITDLRGGVWNDSLSNIDDVHNFYPSKILIVWDVFGRSIEGIAKVKSKLRNLVDLQKTSLIHSSDNYQESLDYISVCMPDKIEFYQNEKLVLKKFNHLSITKNDFKSRLENMISKIKMKIRMLTLTILSH